MQNNSLSPPNSIAKQPVKWDWLTAEQVMDLLSISRRTLQNYRDKGILGFSAIGKKFYYRAEEVHACLERHYQPPFAI
jgi:predicted site-specific integrase-resolvase